MKKDIFLDAKSDSMQRENSPYYIPLNADDENKMLDFLGMKNLDELFKHIPENLKFDSTPQVCDSLTRDNLVEHVEEISKKNKIAKTSFLGDELSVWRVEPIVDRVSQIRNLSTAYTPYQPERSQGTLITHWIYQCAMSMLTGFEAVNCSLYDRASALFEAAAAACRMTQKNTVIVFESLFTCDIEVVKTLAEGTKMKLIFAPINPSSGTICFEKLSSILDENREDIAAFLFPQVNTFGLIEDVDLICNLADKIGAKKVAVIDAYLIGSGGLKPPSEFGANGADMIVGDAQNLCSTPNFGGPGLGIFAVRYSQTDKNSIRNAPGRFVGKGFDASGKDAYLLVLSTREQHIRRQKATSNICSNQAFMATLTGAALLSKSDNGMREALAYASNLARETLKKILALGSYKLAFTAPFFNEFTIICPENAGKIIAKSLEKFDVCAGIDVSGRLESADKLLKISFTDLQTFADADLLVKALAEYADSSKKIEATLPQIPDSYLRKSDPNLPHFDYDYLSDYYLKLGSLNATPDEACYPLGSCTMKHNPRINDYLAGLDGFTLLHPQVSQDLAQGSLEILWNIQEFVKSMTGLDAVACQPVSGAQGELCAIKMFQAYLRDNSKTLRDIVLLPNSAHGTNFATAAVAGYEPEKIISLAADSTGQLSIDALKEALQTYKGRVACIMVTNPNTSGIFETNFKTIADLVHAEGGLVYMDGANYNAIASRVNLKKMGVDALHNNLHKTWSISHGGGGPGDAIVAVDSKLADYIPAYVVEKSGDKFKLLKPSKTIGSLHRHYGNFAHKIRMYAYLKYLGSDGVKKMSGVSVLAARYLFKKLKNSWNSLPAGAGNVERMHEFILTLSDADFENCAKAGITRPQVPALIGKMFLDFGFHSPTVSFPEALGIMIEPTESYSLAELERFSLAVEHIAKIVKENPSLLQKSPRFTPVGKIDEVGANRSLKISETLSDLPQIYPNKKEIAELSAMSIQDIYSEIISQG